MAGTVEGGKRAAATNKAKYGADFYKIIGARGGEIGRTGGVYNNPKLAAKIGAMGGRKSKVGLKLIKETATKLIYVRSSDNSIVEYKK